MNLEANANLISATPTPPSPSHRRKPVPTSVRSARFPTSLRPRNRSRHERHRTSLRGRHGESSVRDGGFKEELGFQRVALPGEGHTRLRPKKVSTIIPAATPVAFLAPTASLHRFDAYRLALAFRAHVVRWLPLKRGELFDQLDRASISAVLNLAEGAGRSGLRDQARDYAIARGSPFECLAVLDLLNLEAVPPAAAKPASSSFA